MDELIRKMEREFEEENIGEPEIDALFESQVRF